MKCKNCKILPLELYNTCIHFTVTGSDIVNYKCVNFNHETEPDIKLITALRITSAIPFVFPLSNTKMDYLQMDVYLTCSIKIMIMIIYYIYR